MGKKEKSVRFDEATKMTIKDIAPKGSQKRFLENAVRDQADDIRSLVQGGELIRRLDRLLNDIDGISEEPLDVQIEPKLSGENYSKTIYTELDSGQFDTLDDIADNSGLTISDIIRCCAFKHLHEIADISDSAFSDWKAEKIMLEWYDIRNNLLSLRSKFHERLFRRFSLQYTDTDQMDTRRIVRSDQKRFHRFAQKYTTDFHGSTIYDRMIETFDERTFSNVEAVIEEESEFSFDTDDDVDDFLAEVRDG